jgi:linoleoyl-CoA desaturase
MKIKGKVKFHSKEKNEFFNVLKKRVDTYFEENNISKYANVNMVSKTIILMIGYLIPFLLIVLFQISSPWVLLLWAVMGVCMAGIGMSVMHDANHGAYSTNDSANKWIGYSLNLLGGSVLNWKLQHNILHHTYTNVCGMDDDIADRLVLKFSPHTKVKWYHRFQPFYAFFFYGIITAYWVFLKDFIQFSQYTKNGVNAQDKRENFWTLIKIIALKVVYLFVMIYVPIFFFALPVWQVAVGFTIMHVIAGITLSVVFQLAHTVDETSHPLPNNSGNIENDWAIHQMNTTMDFSPNSHWLSWYVGGLNFQVEHHLFPKICHVHYPAISKIVKLTADEYGIPYLVNPTFFGALKSHLRALKRFGTLPKLAEMV